MAHSDFLADALIRIKNGQMARHAYVIVNASKKVANVLNVLKNEGYISNYEGFESRKGINLFKVDLKYYKGGPVIQDISKVSKGGRRVYSSATALKKPFNGLGLAIISTSQGIMPDDEARTRKLGGEILCNVY